MSPIASLVVSDAQTAQVQRRNAASQFRDQWWNPSDIFSLLLIIGPDIIQAALAQQAGYLVTPTVFSFGWVAYAFNSLLAVFGDTSMMPNPDYPAEVINAKFRHVRENKSWIIGRLLRDKEALRRYTEKHTRDDNEEANTGEPEKQAFQISFFRFDQSKNTGELQRDWKWYSGFAVMFVQLVVSIIPIITKGNWAPATVTAGGTILALLHGAVRQWKKEKWAGSTKCGSTVSITQGNGSRYVMVILGSDHDDHRDKDGKDRGLDIETLASSSKRKVSWQSRSASVGLAILWTVLLISVTGLKEDTWYLMGVGLIGMIHSIYVAGAAREPSALGVHLREDRKLRITTRKIHDALKEAEKEYPFVGSSLINTFFPGGMQIDERDRRFWERAAKRRKLKGIEQLNITLEDEAQLLPDRATTA